MCVAETAMQGSVASLHIVLILRQSGLTDYEKPFLYLLFGDQKAYLFDTGSLNGHPAPIVAKIIADYMVAHPSPLELIVGHSHSHWDHVAGDSEMKNFSMPGVTTKFIAPDLDSVIKGYSFHSWPERIAIMDLGSRRLDVLPIPGHTPDAIAVYDRQTGLLLTGDSVYPGRIYIPGNAIKVFKESHKRLQRFALDSANEIKWILGCHIEQKKTPFEEYPIGTRRQPDEHTLQLNVSILEDMAKGLDKLHIGMAPGQIMFKEFSWVVQGANDIMQEWKHVDQFPLAT
ncbi:hypothetical protein EG328_011340 [Venturia inaequalis]|uniref:Metallo-beta-lactamase domain-containing protein n=1 Tax=Venturia inaequalis TaxID=5025 RepID=A0A8H3V3P6_VENIN|nr:hypothetical protein EG328_011340 [Venturia inaequalis]